MGPQGPAGPKGDTGPQGPAGVSGVSVTTGLPVAVPRDFAAHVATASCPFGSTAISGGYSGGRSILVIDSHPDSNRGWLITGYNNDYNVDHFHSEVENLQAWVVCAQTS
jgi:hypothetical protein